MKNSIYIPICILCILLCSGLDNTKTLAIVPSADTDPTYRFYDNDALYCIDHVRNYCNARKMIRILRPEKLLINAVGEAMMKKDNNKRDVFEIYFDLPNLKNLTYSSRENRFYYFSEQGGSSPDIATAFNQTSDTSYNIEFTIPYKTLGASLGKGSVPGFDFALTDNDNGFDQDKQVAWHSTDSDIWLSPKLWGNLRLVGEKDVLQGNDSTGLSFFCQDEPLIDGKEDFCWLNIPSLSTKHLLYGKVNHNGTKTDIYGEVKSIWNTKGISFFVKIADDVIIKKSYTGKLFDYGWIEDIKGNVVWSMNRSNVFPAGGSSKNFRADTVLNIMPGTYYLCYVSDESHAYDNWEDTPPTDSLYGIRARKI